MAQAIVSSFSTLEAVTKDAAPYRAIDALNSFVRSDAFGRQYLIFGHALRRQVYAMKNQAIRRAHAAQLTTHRRVSVVTQCRDCGGTGRYVPWSGEQLDHCRACSNTGTVTLRFVETTVAGVGAWHTPEERFPNELTACLEWPDWRSEDYEASWSDVSETWTVNQPGGDLDPPAVAEHLVIAEAAFYWPRWSTAARWQLPYLKEQGDYRLYIGEEADRCHFCHAPRVLDREKRTCNTVNWCVHHNDVPVRWRIVVCDPCSKKHQAEFLDQSRIPFPDHLASAPAVRQWLDVRAGLAAMISAVKSPEEYR